MKVQLKDGWDIALPDKSQDRRECKEERRRRPEKENYQGALKSDRSPEAYGENEIFDNSDEEIDYVESETSRLHKQNLKTGYATSVPPDILNQHSVITEAPWVKLHQAARVIFRPSPRPFWLYVEQQNMTWSGII